MSRKEGKLRYELSSNISTAVKPQNHGTAIRLPIIFNAMNLTIALSRRRSGSQVPSMGLRSIWRVPGNNVRLSLSEDTLPRICISIRHLWIRYAREGVLQLEVLTIHRSRTLELTGVQQKRIAESQGQPWSSAGIWPGRSTRVSVHRDGFPRVGQKPPFAAYTSSRCVSPSKSEFKSIRP